MHKHAALMLEYAQDAAKTDKPWELWESRSSAAPTWKTLVDNPVWCVNVEYRRKPQRIQATIDIPAPCRTPLKYGEEYYYIDLYAKVVEQVTWWNDDTDRGLLADGFIYTNKEDAQAAVDAIAKTLFKGESQ